MTYHVNLPPLMRAADLMPATIDRDEHTIEVVWPMRSSIATPRRCSR
jgi:hypothetical protein